MRLADAISQALTTSGGSRMRGKIFSVEIGGLYIIETLSGQRHRAESDASYSVGETVTFFQGRILGRCGSGGGGKVYVR